MDRRFFGIGAVSAFLSVAAGAFGAHALKGTLETHRMTEVWKTAVLYHFIHALALLLLAVLPTVSRATAT